MSIKLKDTISDLIDKAIKDNDGYTIKDTYLKLSGGTLTGKLVLRGNIGEINNLGSGTGINMSSTINQDRSPNNTIYVSVFSAMSNYVGFQIGHYGGDTTSLWVRSVNDQNTFGNWYKLWNAGNDGSGSGLDADLLDGNHASAFATSGHNHNSSYAPKSHSHSEYLPFSGGTMKGILTMGSYDINFIGSDPGDIVWFNENGIETHRIWSGTGTLNYRNGPSATTRSLIHSGNYTDYCAKASHTHNYAGSSEAGGVANSSKSLNCCSFTNASEITFDYVFWTANGGCSDISSMGYAAVMNVGNDLYRGWQIWNSRNDHNLYWRPALSDGSAWKSTPHFLIDSNNYKNYCSQVGHNHDSVYSKLGHTHDYATSGHNHDGRYSVQCNSIPSTGRLGWSGFYEVNKPSNTKNQPFSSEWMHLINCQHSNTANNYALQIAASFYDNSNFKIRVTNGSDSTGWNTILHNNNWSSYCAAASHTHSQYLTSLPSHTHSYYPLSGNTNMSGDNVWIGSTMGGGTDYWRIGGYGSSDNGICRITIGDNYNDKFQVQIADYSGTTYTPLEVTYNTLNTYGLANIIFNGRTLTIGSQNADRCHYSTDAPCHWFNKLVRVAGDIYGGSSYNRRLAYVDEVALSGHTHNYAGSGSSGGAANSANCLNNVGWGNGNFTWYQTSSSFFGNSGWASYLISNHGDGQTYYNVTIALPFWSVPKYKRLEGGTEKGWYDFITSENISSQSVSYASSAGSASNSSKWGGYNIVVGSTGSDANTFYITV